MSFGKRIRSLDIFKKVPSDLSQSTNLGGLISIFTVLLILFFTYKQLQRYLNPEYSASIHMDKLVTRDQMTINIDIEFQAFPCAIISLDLEDIMISHHPNIGSVEKWRLDKDGNYMDKRNFQLLNENNPFKQLETVRQAFKNKQGCRLIGSFTVKEVPGNFHISCHAYFNHLMQMRAQGIISQLNISHKIHQLYFGKQHHLKTINNKHKEAQLHLLQGKEVVQKEDRSVFYHIDIVPTLYQESSLTSYRTYQYTFKEHAYPNTDQPAVLHFNYQIGGLQVKISPLSEDIFIFLSHLCAIVGGVYAISKAAHNLMSNFRPKFQYQLLQ